MFAGRRTRVAMVIAGALTIATVAAGASKSSSKSRSSGSSRSTAARQPALTKTDNVEAARKGVQASLDEFYVALSDVFKGRMSPMADIWMHTPDVTLMGPLGGRQTGWDQVKAQWDREAKLKLGGHVEPEEIVIQITGDMACVVCTEVGQRFTADGQPFELNFRATNIFRRDREGGGKWKMIHHHTDVSPDLQTATGFTPKAEPAARK